jgi:hypothetical protein
MGVLVNANDLCQFFGFSAEGSSVLKDAVHKNLDGPICGIVCAVKHIDGAKIVLPLRCIPGWHRVGEMFDGPAAQQDIPRHALDQQGRLVV